MNIRDIVQIFKYCNCSDANNLQDKNQFINHKTRFSCFFHPIGSNSFFVNATCILADSQILTINKTYLFAGSTNESGIELKSVKLLNVHLNGGIIYIILLDMLTGRTFKVNHNMMKNGEEICNWMLIDLDYFLQQIRKIKSKQQKHNTLLEFDF